MNRDTHLVRAVQLIAEAQNNLAAAERVLREGGGADAAAAAIERQHKATGKLAAVVESARVDYVAGRRG